MAAGNVHPGPPGFNVNGLIKASFIGGEVDGAVKFEPGDFDLFFLDFVGDLWYNIHYGSSEHEGMFVTLGSSLHGKMLEVFEREESGTDSSLGALELKDHELLIKLYANLSFRF